MTRTLTVAGKTIETSSLTVAQLDGIACVVDGDEMRPMAPCGTVDGCQVFACSDHVTAPSAPTVVPKCETVLVVGDTSNPVALADTTAFGFDCADRLQMFAEVAVGMNYDVTQYAGVVLWDDYLSSVASAVLGTEALEADMFAVTADDLYTYDVDGTCCVCGDEGHAVPALIANIWTRSICRPCLHAAG